jgi:hypothetical protein
MRSTLTALSVVALLAAGASSAAARPADMPIRHVHVASRQPVAGPSVGQQHRYLGSDARLVPSPIASTPLRPVHVATTRVTDGGINWADVGIGAGLAAALLLSAAVVWAARREPPMTTR